MTDNDLKKLSRNDLLQMLLDQGREMQELKEKLAAAEEALRDKTIKIDQAGSIAEAALTLNRVFEAAQAACQQYTSNIRDLSQKQEEICARRESESLAKANEIIEEAKRQKNAIERNTRAQCAVMLEKAKLESQKYWSDVSAKLEAFSATHAELRRLLSVSELTQQE